MATRKSVPAKKGSATAKSRSGGRVPRSMPKAGKDPQGGLTAKGREFFNRTEGSHLRPGVKGAADTPEKMVRKGSFLRRHFANPRGPMVDGKGAPTRLALSAQAWGEPLPRTPADAKKLAAKGHQLLETYHELQGDAPAKTKTAAKTAKRAAKTPAKKTVGKKAARKTSRKLPGNAAETAGKAVPKQVRKPAVKKFARRSTASR